MNTKSVATMGIFVALMIGGQLALYTINGIEVVSLLLLTYSFKFGIKKGLFVATTFSVLRCFIFGFIPQVIILYLVYYNLFSVICGIIGKKFNNEYSVKTHLILTIVAILLTIFFTLLDNIITPLFYGYNKESFIAYAYASLYALIPHTLCVGISVTLLFKPMHKILVMID